MVNSFPLAGLTQDIVQEDEHDSSLHVTVDLLHLQRYLLQEQLKDCKWPAVIPTRSDFREVLSNKSSFFRDKSTWWHIFCFHSFLWSHDQLAEDWFYSQRIGPSWTICLYYIFYKWISSSLHCDASSRQASSGSHRCYGFVTGKERHRVSGHSYDDIRFLLSGIPRPKDSGSFLTWKFSTCYS